MTTIFDKKVLPEAKAAADKAFYEVILERVPAIQKLESLDSLVDLNLTRIIDRGNNMLVLKYSANAPAIYPNIRKELLDKGIAKTHNFFGALCENVPAHHVREVLKYYGSRLQVFLTVYMNKQPRTH